MRESSDKASRMASEGSFTKTGMSTMENGKTTGPMATVFSRMVQELGMREIGRWTSNTDTEKRSLTRKDRCMKASSVKVISTEKELSSGRTEATTKVTLLTGNMRALGFTTSLTREENTKENS